MYFNIYYLTSFVGLFVFLLSEVKSKQYIVRKLLNHKKYL